MHFDLLSTTPCVRLPIGAPIPKMGSDTHYSPIQQEPHPSSQSQSGVASTHIHRGTVPGSHLHPPTRDWHVELVLLQSHLAGGRSGDCSCAQWEDNGVTAPGWRTAGRRLLGVRRWGGGCSTRGRQELGSRAMAARRESGGCST
jgi:hypothetical protein